MESTRATRRSCQLLSSIFLISFLLFSPINISAQKTTHAAAAHTPAEAPSTSASPPPAKTKAAPAPSVTPKSTVPETSGPPNIVTILQKAGGQFTTFIKLLRSTLVANQVNNQLTGPTQGLTVFAPTDGAFSALGSGALNALSTEQQLHLIQFHVLPAVYTLSQFDTITNPVHTQAGNSENGEYPLNITVTGNAVNISTGVVNATVTQTVYTDDQFSVFEVDKVLLPMDIFGRKTTPVAAPSPAPLSSSSKPEKAPAVDDSEAPAKPAEVANPNGANGLMKKNSGVLGAVMMLAMGGVVNAFFF